MKQSRRSLAEVKNRPFNVSFNPTKYKGSTEEAFVEFKDALFPNDRSRYDWNVDSGAMGRTDELSCVRLLHNADDRTLDWAVLLTVVSMVELVLLVLEMVLEIVVFSETTVNVLLACCLNGGSSWTGRSRNFPLQVVCHQLTLSLDCYETALFEGVTEGLQNLTRFLGHLYSASFASAFHPGRNVHSVAPDVVVRLAGTNHTRRNGPMINAHLQYEMVEGLLINTLQGLLQLERKLHQQGKVCPPNRYGIFWFNDAGRV
uniref:Uncharacterized protein n=1 Tax=Anopheles culicifacies TaxID=139723 RepID=A0A182MM86_9DIPT